MVKPNSRVLAAVASVAAIGAIIGASAIGGQGQHRVRAAGDRPEPVRSQYRRVAFDGVVFTLPSGWTRARPGCGWPANKSVVINYLTGPPMFCPDIPAPARLPTAVTLIPIYGPQYALGWAGRRTTWHGQPAWLAVQANRGVTSVTLTLPWLNAAVTTESPRPARARALLDRLSVRSVTGLAVVRSASSVFIQSLAGRDGDHLARNASVTRPADVRRLLADLRSLRPVASANPACDGSWWPDTALLTVHPRHGPARTYAAQFGRCHQAVGGTGTAAAVAGPLLADIRRLVPSSGL